MFPAFYYQNHAWWHVDGVLVHLSSQWLFPQPYELILLNSVF